MIVERSVCVEFVEVAVENAFVSEEVSPVGGAVVVSDGVWERREVEVFWMVELPHEFPQVGVVRRDEPRLEGVGEGGEFLKGAAGFLIVVGFGFDAGGVSWRVLVERDDVDASVEEVVGLESRLAGGIAESPRVAVPDDACDVVFRSECGGDVVNAFPM